MVNPFIPQTCRQILYHLSHQGSTECAVPACRPVAQLQPPLYDPTDYSPPGSSVHGNLQARILKWVAIYSSRESSLPRDCIHVHLLCLLHWPVGSLPLVPGKPPELVVAANFTYPALFWPLGLSWPPVLAITSQGVSYRNHLPARCTGFPFTWVIHRPVCCCSVSYTISAEIPHHLFPLVPGLTQAI